MVNWRKIFGSSRAQPSSDPDDFREFALRVLRERFHDADFTPTDEPLVIRFGDHQFGLQSSMATFLRDNLTPEETRELIVTHFERMLADLSPNQGPSPVPWHEAVVRIRPQIMPIEYLEQAPAPLLAWELNDDVAIAIVVDQENSYSYVREEDLSVWSKTRESVRERAVDNLNRASAGMQMQSSDGPDKFVGIQVADGYDAARILIPGLRELLASQLGSPFYVGIPNRDFLICWSASCSQRFHDFARGKIAKDFEVQPYPLSPEVFIASTESFGPEPPPKPSVQSST
jgi:hypothetical protein